MAHELNGKEVVVSGNVVIYNLGGKEELGRVSVQHAIKMVYKNIARIYESVPGESFGPFEKPKAIELLKYVYARWKYDRTGEVPFSKRAVLRRDKHLCAYCGGKATTVDHIMPKWQGNALTWMNAIAACQPCNHKKGGRSPREAGMKMRFAPRVPSFAEAYAWTHDK
jgi:hypothetical protein